MPVETLTLLAFIPAAFALNLTPGADMMFCLSQGVRGGTKAAIAADLGISLGAMIHVTLAGLGLGAAVVALPWLFEVIRWIGVGYLLWLAFTTLRRPVSASAMNAVMPRRAFRDALIVNLTNPKIILFVLAFLPQFVDPTRAVLPQFLILGAILSLGGFIVNGLVGVFAGSIGKALSRNERLEHVLRIVSASIFGILAARLIFTQRN